jgi:hypothetical protein
VPLPLSRSVADASGFRWLVTVDRGRLVLQRLDEPDADPIVLQDPTDLRWLGMQTHRAAVEFDLDVQYAAAKASADRRQRRILAGEPVGVRHRPYDDDNVQPAIHADPLIRLQEPA